MPVKKPPVKKLTKKELQQQRKLQALKKQQELRKKRQQEQIQRLENQRKRRQQQQKDRQEEKIRLDQQSLPTKQFFQRIHQRVQQLKKKTVDKQNQSKYLNSGVTPNPRIIPDLTSFIVQYKNMIILPLVDSAQKIQQHLDRVQESQEVVRQLQIIKYQSLSDNDLDMAHSCHTYLQEIRHITNQKLDELLSGMLYQSQAIVQKQIAKQSEFQTKSKHDDKKTQAVRKYKPQPDFKFGVYIYQQSSTKAFKLKTAKFPQYGIQAQTPQKLMNSSTVLKCLWQSYDNVSSKQYSKDFVVGGVLILQFYQLLSNSKKTNSWHIRNDYDGVSILQATKYPLVSGPRQSSFSVTYHLPSYIYLKHINRFNMRIAALDNNGNWVEIFISQTPIYDHLKKGQKSLRFNVSKQGPIAYIQPRCFDFPYKSFQLRSLNQEVVLLTLIGQRQVFQFKIISGSVYLLNNSQPQLVSFVKQGYEPIRFLHQLAKVGILLIPVDLDAETAGINNKERKAQQRALKDLAYLVNGFYIRCSPFNNRLGGQRSFAKIRQNPDNDLIFYQDQQKDWITMGWWQNKCAAFNIKQNQNGLIQELRSKTHLTCFNMLQQQEMCQQKLIKRIKGTQPGLYNTVAKFLINLQLLSFTVPQYISKHQMIP